MGIYSTNRYDSLGNYTVEPVAGYNGEIGAAISMIECTQNDLALFNGIIASDFQTACMVTEGADAEEIYVVQEGALSAAWEKLKAFFKKLWEKIKSIFHTFIAKMDSVFMKDSKAFYKKYIKEINSKTDWEDFKIKCRPVKTAGKYSAKFTSANGTIFVSLGKDDLDIDKTLKNWDSEDEFKDVVDDYIDDLKGKSITKTSELEQEYFDLILDDEETKDDWTQTDITEGWVGGVLKDRKLLSDLERENSKIEKAIKSIISDIDKAQKNLSNEDRSKYATDEEMKKDPTTATTSYSYKGGFSRGLADNSLKDNGDRSVNTKEKLNNLQARYNYASKKANIIQTVFNAYASTSVKCVKYISAQARRIFAAAVAYNPKKNESTLVEFIGDAAFNEAVELMDSMYYAAE